MPNIWDEELANLQSERGTTAKIQRRTLTDNDLGGHSESWGDRAGLTTVAGIIESLGAQAGEISRRLGVEVDTLWHFPISVGSSVSVSIDSTRDQIVGVSPSDIAGKVYYFPKTGKGKAAALVHPIGTAGPSNEGKHVEVYCKEQR